MSDPSIRSALPTSIADFRVISNSFLMPKLLKAWIKLPSSSVCVATDNFFVNLNIKIGNDLVTSGIMKYWVDYFLYFDMKPLLEPPSEPKVFDIEDLKFGFNVWLVAFGISAAAFFIEVFYFYFKFYSKRFVKNMIAVYHIRLFLSRGKL